MITHYVPQWLLDKFRDSGLFELNIYTRKVEPRKTRKAGAGEDLWPPDIEDKMSVLDNSAARIYRERISNQSRIIFSDNERWNFAQWLALFFPRSPSTMAEVDRMVEQTIENSQFTIEMIGEDKDAVWAVIQKDNPEICSRAIEQHGEIEAKNKIIKDLIEQFRSRRIKPPKIDAQNTYHNHLRNAQLEKIAQKICASYAWIWLRSQDGFVIGDCPFVPWHAPTGRWRVGIDNPNVEITIPLSSSLCLFMEQKHAGTSNPRPKACGFYQTREINRRQRYAAQSYVYGGKPSLLDF